MGGLSERRLLPERRLGGLPERRLGGLPGRRLLPERRHGGLPERRLGGWNTVLGRSYRGRMTTVVHLSQRRMVTIFVEDLPDRMDQWAFQKMFTKFGVVKDAYIPRKMSKAGKRFGFIRYDCMVAAKVAILKTTGLWIDDKELMVKMADFDKSKEKSMKSRGNNVKEVYGDMARKTRMIERQVRSTEQQGKRLNPIGSYADVVRNAGAKEDTVSLVRGICVGNDWLYRSVVATFRDHPRPDIIFDSFMEQEKDILAIEDDTAKCVRCDIVKIKVFTRCLSVINQQLKLQVGALNYRIRVSEEPAVFIVRQTSVVVMSAMAGKRNS
ncbi:RNA recognition motif-containing protein [Dionaea muscipula]